MKNRKLMIIIISIFGFILIMLTVGKINLSVRFNKQVEVLFSQSNSSSGKSFKHEQIIGLPEPVQRYFKHVLKEGQPFISSVRFSHNGQFKPGLAKDWVNIKGEQYVTTEKPGFIWKGTTSMFTARDMYIADKGRLIVSIFSIIDIVDGKGEKYDQGELIRWLGESVLYPTNLLPGERLQWSAINSQSAKLTFNYGALSLFYLVTFNDAGEITQLETKRYMDEKYLETWIIKLAEYKEINGVVVPTSTEVLWRLEKGDFIYAKFMIKRIEYNKPERY
jgi:hypothetical protein